MGFRRLLALSLALLASTAPAFAQTIITNGSTLSGSETGNFLANSGTNFNISSGTVFSGGITDVVNGYVYLQGTGTVLTIASDGAWTGDVQVQATAANETFVNNGSFTNTGGTNNIFGNGNTGFQFTNTGTVSATAGTLYVGNGSNNAVVNTGTILASGGNVYVGYTSGTVANNAGGTLQANAGSTLTLGSGTTTWTNAGNIFANGGTIDLGGNFTTANLTSGAINSTGGTINITGNLDNTVGPLNPPNSGIYTLNSGMITNGTVNSGALTFGNSGGKLNAVTMNGAFNAPISSNFTVENGTLFTAGTTTFGGSNYVYLAGTGTALTIDTNETWSGSVQVQASAANLTFVNNGVFTNTGSSNNIFGNGNSGFHFTNTGTVSATGGTLYVGNGPNDTILNSSTGTISASTGGAVYVGYTSGNVTNNGLFQANSGSSLTLGSGTTNWTNSGTINAAAGGTVNLGGSFTTANLTSGIVSMATTGTLNITGNLDDSLGGPLNPPSGTGAVYTLNGGTISNGTVNSGALTFANSGGKLNAVTMNGTFNAPSSSTFTAENGTLFEGGTTTFGNNYLYLAGTGTALTLNSDAVWTGNVQVQATAPNLAFVNNGTFTNTSGSNNIFGNSNLGFSFTNNGTVSATGGALFLGNGGSDNIVNSSAGTIWADNGPIYFGYNVGATVSNAGNLKATGASGVLYLGSQGSTWSNTGTITASALGTVDFGGSIPTSYLAGSINGSTGTLNITGMVNNLSSTLDAPTLGGIFTLDGGIISNGSVTGGALTFNNSGGTLDNVTMNGSFSFPVATYANVTAKNNTTFTGNGTTSFAGAGYDTVNLNGTGTALTIASGSTWTGGVNVSGQSAGVTFVNLGTIDFTLGGNSVNGNNTGFTFTNTGTVNLTAGTTYLGYYLNDLVTNGVTGTMTASGAGSILDLGYNQASWNNLGFLMATSNGVINFQGNYSTANLGGTIDANGGGILDLEGSLNNASATLNPPHSGIYTLAGATITGGTVATGALTFGNSGGTLSGVTMTGNFSLPSAAYANFTATNNTTFTGGGTTTFSTGGYDTVNLGGTGTALTIAPGATWTGDIDIYSQTANLTFLNQGNFNAANGSANIHGNNSGFTFTNTGTVTVSPGASLTLGYYSNDAVTNALGGTMTANGGTLYLGYIQGTWQNLGALMATNAGVINFDGTYTTADLGGTIDANTGGLLNLGGSLNNAAATLNPPNSGIYTLAGATITGGSVASGALTFSNSGGTLSGVTMNGSFSFPSAAYASFYAASNTTFASGSTTTFATAAYDTVNLSGTGNALTIASGATWTGDFSVISQASNLSFSNQGSLNLTSGSGNIHGNSNGFTFTNTGSVSVSTGASLYLGYYSNDTITNGSGGTMTADGGTLNLGYNQAAWSNAGTLLATNNGAIDFEGIYTTASFGGTIGATAGGVLNLVGAFSNAASTLNPPNSGVYTLDGGTITGGTVASSALTFGNSGGTLDGVTMSGNFSFPSAAYATVTVKNNTTFTGGTTTFTTAGYDTVDAGTTGTSLTIAPSATWTGSFNLNGQAANVSVLNQGAINLGTGSSIFYGNSLGFTFLNGGLLDETGGTLYLGNYANDTFTNQVGGTLEANGGTVYVGYNVSTQSNLSANTLTNGTWEAAGGGTLAFYGTANSIVTNDATIILSGTGAFIETRSGAGPGYQTVEGTLTTNNGTLNVLANRNFASGSAGITNNGTIEMGGTPATGGIFTAASLVNNPGSTLSGSGTFAPTGGVTIGNGVLVSPGSPSANNYVATLSFNSASNPLTLGQGGAMTFDISNGSGLAGTGYDTLNVTGTLTISATSGSPFAISVESINPGTGLPGLVTFNMAQSYQWTLASATSIAGFSTADFTISNGSFANSLGGGYFTVSASTTDIFLNFTPVPEPSTWVLVASGAALIGLMCWRRRPAKPASVR